MIISWYGEACFLLEASGLRIITNPPQKDSGLAIPRLKTDILIFSKPQPEREVSEETFVIDGAGEYEVKGVEIRGLSIAGKDKELNTIYIINFDDFRIAHLGYLTHDLEAKYLEFLGDPDILFLPVDGNAFLDAEKAVNLMNKIEPCIVIPMLFAVKGLKRKADSLSDFIKESGASNEPQPKLTVKKKDLPEDETQIVTLNVV